MLPSCGREVVELRWVLCSVEGAVGFMGLQRAAGLHHLCQCIWRSQHRIRIKSIAGPNGFSSISLLCDLEQVTQCLCASTSSLGKDGGK